MVDDLLTFVEVLSLMKFCPPVNANVANQFDEQKFHELF